MNDYFIINGAKTLIYAACLYDLKKEEIILLQVRKIIKSIKIIKIEIYSY